MMSNSNSIDVLDDLFNTRIKLLQEKHCYGRLTAEFQSAMSNSNAFDALEWRKPILGNLMEALADPNTHLIGVYGSDDAIKETLLEKVYRRVQRDKMFGMVVRASITKYPDMRKIQENIATQLGLTFNQKSKDKRALELIHRIKNEQSILIVLGDLCKGFELSKVGIPYGADHTGCKVLLTSTSEDVLSTHMHTQKNFMV
ncbi:hypothetical protein QN277_005838 [Acacia crassicarpa]|uniref:NB-ARC domain-containing protein n=1 Tax=Acacia crassicarpa TaxID=499986 RepID=A0AAE1J0I4_9FABA|nr:hypothetical protein QN277_005838 [Acacia crassicarpa]